MIISFFHATINRIRVVVVATAAMVVIKANLFAGLCSTGIL